MANSKAGDKFKVIPGLNRWAQVNSCGASVPRMLLAVCNTPSALDTGTNICLWAGRMQEPGRRQSSFFGAVTCSVLPLLGGRDVLSSLSGPKVQVLFCLLQLMCSIQSCDSHSAQHPVNPRAARSDTLVPVSAFPLAPPSIVLGETWPRAWEGEKSGFYAHNSPSPS